MKFPFSEKEFICDYGKCSRASLPFKQECIETAKHISRNAQALGRVPVVMLSGGLDSEVIVKSFIDAQVPFRIATFRMPNNLNSHEMVFVNKFITRHKLEVEFFDIDVLKWLGSAEAEQYWLDAHALAIHYTMHLKLMDHIWMNGGYPVIGEEGQLEYEDGQWNYVENEHFMVPFRYMEVRREEACCGFLMETPEMLHAFMTHPKMVELGTGNNKIANILLKTSREVKYDIYFESWPDLESRKKYHGSEKILPISDKIVMQLYEKHGYPPTRVWRMPYNQFIERLNK